MKRILLLCIICIIFLSTTAQIVNLNPDPNGPPWITGGVPLMTDEMQQRIDEIPHMERLSFIDPPEAVDNSQNDYMRPIIQQTHACCAQASGVAYVFTYEINWLRNLEANTVENQYPTHFTYNYLNNGDPDNGSLVFDGWDIIIENGCPNIQTYGSIDANGEPTFWMSGYENYYSALQNRISFYETIDLTDPEEGLTNIKQWLFNHNIDNMVGGLASFQTNMEACQYSTIQPPSPEYNKHFISEYVNPSGDDHQLTIVGYNDISVFGM